MNKIYLNQTFLFENRVFLESPWYEKMFEETHGLNLIGEDLINGKDVLVFEILDKKKASIFIIQNSKFIIYE